MKIPVQGGVTAGVASTHAEFTPMDSDTQLIDLLPVMAWTATANGRVNFVNLQWSSFTGLTREQLLASGMIAIVHPDDLGTRTEILQMLTGKTAFEYEIRMQRHDGQYRRCLVRAVPDYDIAGHIVRWVGTTIDVEDMRVTSDQMKAKEDHYQLALESANVGIWRLQMPSMELNVDERTRQHLDLDQNVIQNYDPQTRIHPDDYARSASLQVPLGDGRFETEHRVIQRDGSYRWQAINWRVYFDGKGENAAPALITGTSMDVTSRKQAEAEREALSVRYRMALDAAELGTWHHDLLANIVHLDPRACTHFGVEQSIVDREQFIACIYDADRQAIDNSVQQQLDRPENNNRATAEFRVGKADGELRWVSSQINVEYADDDSRQAVRVIGVTRDITAMKHAEAQLRDSEARLRRFAEQIDDALWLGDPNTMLPLYLSPGFERMGGEALINDANAPGNWLHTIHPDDRKHMEHLTATRYRTGFTAEFRIVHRDGSMIWARNRTFPIYDDQGVLIHVGGIIEDITQRKQFEESLRVERERFDRMVSVVPGVLYSYRRVSANEGQYMYMSPGLADLHGVSNEDIARDSFEVFRWVPAEDVRRARQTLAESCHRLVQWRVDYRVLHPSRGLRWLSITAVPVRETDGAVTMHGLVLDITARKQAEEQVRRLNADLELRVQQRTAELTAANEELESFAYAVSHDLRAPLRAMWGFCDALIEDYSDNLPPEAREYLQHVIDGSRHLAEIVDGLLALSRSTRGDLRRDAVDLSMLAEKILRDMARVEPERRVTWTIQPGLHAYGDSRMIDAVMRNLLGNAWKYTAHCDEGLIRVYAGHIAGDYYFFVEDNGAGFNMEHAEKLFLPFQRLHRQDEFQGLGIGLATVQRIIHRHGGKVSGTGTAGHGAKFCFSLPLPDDMVANTPVIERKE